MLAVILSAVVIMGIATAVFVVPRPAAGSTSTADSGLAASIKFVNPNSVASNLPSASVLKPATFSFMQAGTPAFSVVDSTGADVSAANMVIGVNGKIIGSGGIAISSWSLSGTVKLLADGKEYGSYPLAATGSGSPPDPIVIKIGSANNLSVAVSALKQFWGPTNYGQHKVDINLASGSITVGFADSTSKTKQLTAQTIGGTSFTSSSDADFVASVSSNYGSSGTTTSSASTDPSTSPSTSPSPTPTTEVTDTWNSGVNRSLGLTYNIYPLGEYVSDPARFNVVLKSASFYMIRDVPANGAVFARLYDATTNTMVAQSTTGINAADFQSYPTNYTWTFPDGTKTPNGAFRIVLYVDPNVVYYSGGTGPYLTSDGANTYSGGSASSGWKGTSTDGYTYDINGSATYLK